MIREKHELKVEGDSKEKECVCDKGIHIKRRFDDDDDLSPKQLGMGVPGRCKVAVHATRRFLASMDDSDIVVKLDLSNAFNSLYRDQMLASVDEILPRSCSILLPGLRQGNNTKIWRLHGTIPVGPHEGDPLGLLLFCLLLQPTLLQLGSPLLFGYLDDLTLGGRVETIAADVEYIKRSTLIAFFTIAGMMLSVFLFLCL